MRSVSLVAALLATASNALCGSEVEACLDQLAECEAPKAVSARTGGTVVSEDGHASLSVPPGALEQDARISIQRVAAPESDASLASDVYDFSPDGQRFQKPATLCLKADVPAESGSCLGWYDGASKEWKCEDECLEQVSPSFWCGTTDHFTNFAVLLTGSSSDSKCSSDQNDDLLSSKTGGLATSADGAAFISVPPGALVEDTRITVTQVESVEVDTERASGVYSFAPAGLEFRDSATICLQASLDSTQQACLGYYDAAGKAWTCEDASLREVSPSFWCGKTDHFTNFAVLLRGGKK